MDKKLSFNDFLQVTFELMKGVAWENLSDSSSTLLMAMWNMQAALFPERCEDVIYIRENHNKIVETGSTKNPFNVGSDPVIIIKAYFEAQKNKNASLVTSENTTTTAAEAIEDGETIDTGESTDNDDN